MSVPTDPGVEAAGADGGTKGRRGRKSGEKRQSKHRIHAPPPSGAGALSIPQFCAAHGGMSEAMFHKLMRDNRGPKVMKVGGRTLISVEAAATWRREREREAEIAAHKKAEQKAAAAQQQETAA
jgi:predicted DNA-binding transcriptional regulator AlpA